MSKNFKPFRGTINATVNAPELAEGIAKLKHESGEGVREYVRLSRCHNKPGSKRTLTTQLPSEESYTPEGDTITKREKTQTVRTSH